MKRRTHIFLPGPGIIPNIAAIPKRTLKHEVNQRLVLAGMVLKPRQPGESIPNRSPSIADLRGLTRTVVVPVGDQKSRLAIKKHHPQPKKSCMIRTITR
jgi:hypothetical protein